MKTIIGVSGILAILQSILFWNKTGGISVFIFVIACVMYLLYLLAKNKKITNKKAIIFTIPIILLSSTYFIFNNLLFNILNIFVITILGMIMCVYLCKDKIKDRELFRKVSHIFGGMLECISDVIDFMKIPEGKKENVKIEKIKSIGKAVLITIPVIILVLLLLMSADTVFENIFDKVFVNIGEILSFDGIIVLISRIAVAFIVFLLFGGLFINLIKENTMFNKESEEKEISIKFENLTINMILTVLNIIYLIFCSIQITNLFMQKSNIEGFDYSNYARQGFFQLMVVSFINFIILIIANINKKEKTKGQITYNKVMSLLIVIFTIIIIISAIYRMNLYQEAYGFTYLRILVDFVLITEILISVPIIIKLLGKNIDILKTGIIITSFMYVILNFMNIDNFIATKNIDRYFKDPENSNFDINYLCDLGTDATMQMTRLLNAKEEEIVKRTENYLYKQRVWLNTEKMDWQEYNISKKQAKEILNNKNINIEEKVNYYD